MKLTPIFCCRRARYQVVPPDPIDLEAPRPPSQPVPSRLCLPAPRCSTKLKRGALAMLPRNRMEVVVAGVMLGNVAKNTVGHTYGLHLTPGGDLQLHEGDVNAGHFAWIQGIGHLLSHATEPLVSTTAAALTIGVPVKIAALMFEAYTTHSGARDFLRRWNANIHAMFDDEWLRYAFIIIWSVRSLAQMAETFHAPLRDSAVELLTSMHDGTGGVDLSLWRPAYTTALDVLFPHKDFLRDYQNDLVCVMQAYILFFAVPFILGLVQASFQKPT